MNQSPNVDSDILGVNIVLILYVIKNIVFIIVANKTV